MITPRLAPLLDAGLDLRLHIGGREALYVLLLEDKVHLAVTASQPEDLRLAFHALGEEHLRAVASPAVASRIAELPLADGLDRTAHLAYDLDRPLLRTWLEANQIELTSQPALTAPIESVAIRIARGSGLDGAARLSHPQRTRFLHADRDPRPDHGAAQRLLPRLGTLIAAIPARGHGSGRPDCCTPNIIVATPVGP